MFIGIAGVAYYNILSGILRGLGDSVSALIYLLVAMVLNIILDLWFVAGLGLGVPGVALATAIAQAVSAVLCMWKLTRMKDVFDFRLHYLKMKKNHAVNIIRLGLPSGLTQAIFSMAMVCILYTSQIKGNHNGTACALVLTDKIQGIFSQNLHDGFTWSLRCV